MIDLERLRRRDSAYLEEVVRRYSREVIKAVRRFGDDPDEVEDLAQEVWVHVLNNLDSYQGRGQFGAWIYRVAFNHCRMGARQQSIRLRGIQRMKEAGAFRDLFWAPPDPQSRLELEEAILSLHNAISRLPPSQRDAIDFRCLGDRPLAEVAQTMGVEKATVRSYVSKGIKTLRSSLRE
jgi:RNA polymerase sigma-70 factor (ECF subfamily)